MLRDQGFGSDNLEADQLLVLVNADLNGSTTGQVRPEAGNANDIM